MAKKRSIYVDYYYDCPICNKHFLVSVPSLWVYKKYPFNPNDYFCSWKCLRAYEKSKGKVGDKIVHSS